MNLLQPYSSDCRKLLNPSLFFRLCFAINALLVAIPIQAQAQSIVANNSDLNNTPVRKIKLIRSGAPVENRTPTTAKNLLAQAETVKITGVKVSTTEKGVEIRLESQSNVSPQPVSPNNNTVVYDLPNATLALPDAQEYRTTNPAPGIAEIVVTQVTPISVRVSITGAEGSPAVTIATDPNGSILSVTPAPATSEDISITVRGKRKGGYLVPNASTATGTNTPILETPASVQVVPQEVIRDRQATQIKEALTTTSGVTFNGDLRSRGGDQFILRGFTNGAVFRDGFRQSNIGRDALPNSDLATLDRIEVVKGPASILFGAIEPGGLINYVSKQPLATPFNEVELQVGSRNLLRSRFDTSGPLTPNGNVLYRVNGVYEGSNSVRTLNEKNRKFAIAPTVAWKISDRTDVTFSAEYIDSKRPADFGIPAIGNKVANVPIDRIINEPSDAVTNKSLNIGYKLEHRFNENWQLKNAFRYSSVQFDYDVIALPLFDETTNTVNRFPSSQDSQLTDYALQTNVTGKFNTGSVQHTLLGGVDYSRRDNRIANRQDLVPAPLDLFNPVYGLVKPSKGSLVPFTDNSSSANTYGVYLQDQVGITKEVKLLAGIRYDAIAQRNTNQLLATNDPARETTSDASALTPRIGLLYQVTPAVSAYGSYSQSFAPNTDRTRTGAILPPQRGKGYEFGVKSELLDGKLLATLAYFDIAKQNVAVIDPNDPNVLRPASIASGEQRSRGIEFDVSGQLTPAWKIIAAYTNTNATVTADSDSTQIGKKLFGVPANALSLWSTYEIQQGDWKGLGFGAGVNYVGDRPGDLENTYTADAYLTVNATISYKRDDWRFGLAFKNIGNAKYIENVENSRSSGNQFGDPFTVQATAGWQF